MKRCRTRFADGKKPFLPDVKRICKGELAIKGSTKTPYVFNGIDIASILPGVVASTYRLHGHVILHPTAMQPKDFHLNAANLKFASSVTYNLMFEGDFRGKT